MEREEDRLSGRAFSSPERGTTSPGTDGELRGSLPERIPEPVRLRTPIVPEALKALRAGDRVLLDGRVIVARDAAHRRLFDDLADRRGLPFDPVGAAIYYAGPAPARPGSLIGPIGPTTSGRMDAFAPALYRMGVRATIGKGRRSPDVLRAIRETGSVYLGATGGAAALLALRVRAVRTLAFEDLGPEAILELTVEGFPLVVLIDPLGNDLYETGPENGRG